jgi:hypothetical protein
MKKQQTPPIENALDKFDNQLLTILTEDLKSIKYLRTKNIDQLILSTSPSAIRTA